MMDKINRPFITTCLLIFFLSPIGIILYYFKLNLDIAWNDFIYAFKHSLLQSVSTAALCIGGSLLLVPGLTQVKNKWFQSVMTASLLPSLLPSLFTILIVFSYFHDFPFGPVGIVFIFCVTYFGFSTVALYQAFKALVERYAGLIEIYNISVWNRYLKLYLPLLKQDLINVFLIIVLGCFSSLAVPLMAGGGRGANIELLIYESIFINGQWATAAAVALVQVLLMLGLGFYLNQHSPPAMSTSYGIVAPLKKINLSFILFFLYIVCYVMGYSFQVLQAILKVNFQELYFREFMHALSNSLILSFFTVGGFLSIVTALIYLSYTKARSQFLLYFLLPSSTVVGFAIYLLFPEGSSIALDVIKISLGLNLIYCLALYKSYIYPHFQSLQTQLDVCRIYDLSFFEVYRRVIWPQLKKALVVAGNILFIFSFCEFALIKATGAQTLFSGVFIERLISTYHLEQGLIYSFMVLILVFIFFHLTRFLSEQD